MTQNFATSALSQVSSVLGQFPVKELSEFKGIEIPEDLFLARKIEKGTGKNSLGVLIPATTQEEFILALDSELVLSELISHYQSLIEETLKKKISSGATLILAEDFSLTEIEKFLEAKNFSEGRISKEKISSWFSSSVAPTISAMLKEKYSNLSEDKISELVSQYLAQFKNFAKREHYFSEQVWGSLKKVLDSVSDSEMKKYCEKKLQEFSPKAAIEFAL